MLIELILYVTIVILVIVIATCLYVIYYQRNVIKFLQGAIKRYIDANEELQRDKDEAERQRRMLSMRVR